MKIKVKEIKKGAQTSELVIQNNCFDIDEILEGGDLSSINAKYYKGVESVAEFCGKLDTLVASGLTPSEARETIIVLNAIEDAKEKPDNRIF